MRSKLPSALYLLEFVAFYIFKWKFINLISRVMGPTDFLSVQRACFARFSVFHQQCDTHVPLCSALSKRTKFLRTHCLQKRTHDFIFLMKMFSNESWVEGPSEFGCAHTRICTIFHFFNKNLSKRNKRTNSDN